MRARAQQPHRRSSARRAPARWGPSGSLLARATAVPWFALLLLAVYLATAHYGPQVFSDVHAAAHAAWNLAVNGTLDMSGLDLGYELAWTVPVDDALYSDRFPGLILAGVPSYLLLQPEQPLVVPAAVSGVVAAVAGVTAVLVALRRLVPLQWAFAGAAGLGLGTGVWSVAADGLHSHSVTTMWLGLLTAGLVLTGRWTWLVPLGAAMAVLTRPHLAVALGVVAVVLLWRRRRREGLRPRLPVPGAAAGWWLAAGVGVGALGFAVYSRVLTGEWSLTGLYDDRFVDLTAVGELDPERYAGGPVLWRLENLAMAFVAPRVGLLPAHPLLVLLPLLLRGGRREPAGGLTATDGRDRDHLRDVPVALALGGVAYLLVAVTLWRISGGFGFWGNRTLLEGVVLCWPALVVLLARSRPGQTLRLLVAGCVGWSVWFHALGALSPSPAPSRPSDDPLERGSVLFWQVPAGVQAATWWQVVVAVLLALLAAAVWLRLSARARSTPQPARASASTSPSTAAARSADSSSTSR